jgi:hypothetical protein
MMMHMTSEFNDGHRDVLKEDIKKDLIEILVKKLQEKAKQNIQN